MNDAELDRLLDTWQAPAAPPSLREGLRARLPRPEHRSFFRPLRWVLLIAAASLTLAVGMQQATDNSWNDRLVRAWTQLSEHVIETFEAHRAAILQARIRQSEPQVYVDGQLLGPLQYGRAATLNIDVPGEGRYSVLLYRGKVEGWTEAGTFHGNVIEFQAGAKRVRIQCSQSLVDTDRPAFVRRR